MLVFSPEAFGQAASPMPAVASEISTAAEARTTARRGIARGRLRLTRAATLPKTARVARSTHERFDKRDRGGIAVALAYWRASLDAGGSVYDRRGILTI